MKVRRVEDSDLPVIAEMMHQALEPFYGGDHRAHAKRIVETSANGSLDAKGHFSASQVMYVAEDGGQIVGILNFVVKHQGTLKILQIRWLIANSVKLGTGLMFSLMNCH